MSLAEILQRVWRRAELLPTFGSVVRTAYWTLRGAQIGRHTRLPRVTGTWPHQVALGERCILQPDIFFNYDHYWAAGPSIILGDRVFVGRGVEFNIQARIQVGNDALIASGCIFVDHDHGMAFGTQMNRQPNYSAPISVGADAWIGARCVVLKGVTIGIGAVVGAGSVVTRSIPPGEVWVGSPARRIRAREDYK